jgi:hypothetical protein
MTVAPELAPILPLPSSWFTLEEAIENVRLLVRWMEDKLAWCIWAVMPPSEPLGAEDVVLFIPYAMADFMPPAMFLSLVLETYGL